jgi:hypothetical protein
VWKTTTHRPMAVTAATVHLSLGGRGHVISTRDLRRSRARRARRSSRSVSLRLTGMPVIVSIAR